MRGFRSLPGGRRGLPLPLRAGEKAARQKVWGEFLEVGAVQLLMMAAMLTLMLGFYAGLSAVVSYFAP